MFIYVDVDYQQHVKILQDSTEGMRRATFENWHKYDRRARRQKGQKISSKILKSIFSDFEVL